MKNAFEGIFDGRRILITGHTGFKGSWLTLWLKELGAKIAGFSLLPQPNVLSHYSILGMGDEIVATYGDIRDYSCVKQAIDDFQPEVIFHLAAQPIVLHSLTAPKETFDVNAGGTVNILEAARHCPSVKAMVMITSDKCYDNQEWIWGYRENDRLGGSDPYSASKGMAEMAITSYRASYGHLSNFPLIASVRAGNVIGGGDFSDFRIVPDCMRALMERKPICIRNPNSTRPWLHVFDALSGYLELAAHLLTKGCSFATAWNFGPIEHQAIDVQTLVDKAIELWGEGDWISESISEVKNEMGLLRLNWDKAASYLKWKPTYNWKAALEQTVDWFKAYDACRLSFEFLDLREVSIEHLHKYTINRATERDNCRIVNSFI